MSTKTRNLITDAGNKPIPQYYNLDADAFEAVHGSDGALNSKSAVAMITFHNSRTVAADGQEFTVGAYKTLTVEISGTSTSRTVEFKGAGPSGTLFPIMGVRLSDFSTATKTVGSGELWLFDITGLDKVIMDLTAVAGGNVTVTGKAVA
jgi:hypothetical protein